MTLPLSFPPSLFFAHSLSCHSEDGIGMAKHWFETWLADPHAWLPALMSSLRFDDVANKWTLLIIWPLTFFCKNNLPPTLPPPRLPPHHTLHASFSPLSFSGDYLKMRSCLCEHKQGYTSSRAVHPWNDSVQDFYHDWKVQNVEGINFMFMSLTAWHTIFQKKKHFVRYSDNNCIFAAQIGAFMVHLQKVFQEVM